MMKDKSVEEDEDEAERQQNAGQPAIMSTQPNYSV